MINPLPHWRHWLCGLLLATFGTLALAQTAATAPAAATTPFGPLVSVEWLKSQLGRSDLLLIDASLAPQYAKQHIPGAVNADLFSYGPREPSPAAMEQRFQSWGLSPGRKVVLYDPGATYLATRIYFDLLYRGVPAEDIAILDGGLAKWMASGGAVTNEPTPTPARGSYRLPATPREDVRVRLDEFLIASGDPKKNALVEALDPDWHYGATAFFDRAGHVPHAIMWPAADLFNADRTFKSREELRSMALHLGIRPEQQIHTHCGGGVAAAAPFFVLKALLGYPKVKLYQESQIEWLQDPRGLPFWTYDAPSLVRETSWVKGWGGGVLRSFGMSRVSIVDVRPPEAYAMGHIPFAINVPAETLARHAAEPARLAELLGQSGVDARHDAVIVSEGGLTPTAALAFVTLERLGQAHTSVLLDSTERWAELGQEVTRQPTVVGPRKAPTDHAVPAVRYTAAPRATPSTTQYPKLYLASGAGLPTQARARPPEGAQVVHVPYTQVLGADGRPKAAKDIWALLAKAGVTRYAEIVCIADTPGEAAVNYVILRLMGFPAVSMGGV